MKIQLGYRAARTVVVISLATILVACGAISKDISADGKSARQLVWPDADDMNSLASQGSYVTPERISLLHLGLTKKQLQKLIGPPHFNEGVITREWNYLFHLRKADNKEFYDCQYKVLFNSFGVSGSQYWLPAGCGNQQQVVDLPEVLQTDGMFNFDGWQLSTLHSASNQRLEVFAARVQQPARRGQRITIRAYTDRLGGEAYNQLLSERRAKAVAAFLMEKGVEGSRIRALGEGIKFPVTTGCPATFNKNALIECLSPDRRVELEVTSPVK